MNASLPLAGYGRVSRVGARDTDRLLSPEQQRDATGRKARELGREHTWIGCDIDRSGSKLSRPVLDDIIARIQAGEFGGVIVARLDRLSRLKPRDRVELFDTIETAGGVILSASENIDPATPEGRFTREVFLGVARMQWEKYAEGFADAKQRAMARGALLGPTPFGYQRGPGGTIEPHPERAPIVKEAFRVAATEGLDATIAYLKSLDLKHEHGKRAGQPVVWTTTTVRRLLARRTYLGEGSYGDLRAPVPQLVQRHAWEAAQPLEPKRRRPSADFPLSGFALCGSCGGPLVGARGGVDARRTYRCAAGLATSRADCPAPVAVTATHLEEHVREATAAALEARHPGYRGREDLAGQLEAAEQELAAATSEVADLTADLELRRTLGADRFRRLVQAAVQAESEAQDRYRTAARAVASSSEERPSPARIREADLRQLGRLLRGVLDAVIVSRATRGQPLAARVTFVPKRPPM